MPGEYSWMMERQTRDTSFCQAAIYAGMTQVNTKESPDLRPGFAFFLSRRGDPCGRPKSHQCSELLGEFAVGGNDGTLAVQRGRSAPDTDHLAAGLP